MCSLCRLPVAKNHNCGQILTFWGSCTEPLLPMRAKFSVLGQTQSLHLHTKFHVNVFIVSTSGGQNPQFWANFDIWKAPVPTPFYRSGPNLVCYSRLTVYAYLPNFVSIGLFCRPLAAKNLNLCRFLDFGI